MFFVKIIKKLSRLFLKKSKQIIALLFYILPIKKNQVTVYNFNGGGYGDNPKYLVEELVKHGNYNIIWFVKDLKTYMPEGVKKVKYGSLKALFYMITARLWLDTVRDNPKPLFKRKGQYYIQMWHGGIFMKGQERDVEQKLNRGYIRDAKRDSKFADFVLSNCTKRTELIRRAFWFSGEILEFGIPRDDVLFNPRQDEIKELKNRYNIGNKKIILYAPSFRNNENFYTNLNFDYKKIIKICNQKFNDEFVFCIKLHPHDCNRQYFGNFKNIINLTNEADSQLVLSASDIVISDYSSMLLDFILTGKYAFTFAPDYEEYISKERYLYIDLKECGIPFSNNFDELIENIVNIDKKVYCKQINKLLNFYGVFEKGFSSKLIIEELLKRGIV